MNSGVIKTIALRTIAQSIPRQTLGHGPALAGRSQSQVLAWDVRVVSNHKRPKVPQLINTTRPASELTTQEV